MTREHICEECGHYTWAHTVPDKPGGCLVIVEHGLCCGCLKQYADGITDTSKQIYPKVQREDMSYFLPDCYVSRTDAIHDFEGEAERKDDCQREVYVEAAALARDLELQTVLDLGTGSGWKLVTHFKDWCPLDLIGIDLPPAVAILRERYPGYAWSTPDKLPAIAESHKRMGVLPGIELVICSDMIEHVEDPDATCEIIKSLDPKWIVMSTPDRDLVDRYFHPTNKTFGPPRNRCHVREWNFAEFGQYMASHFEVVHHFWSNEKQCTQCAVLRLNEKVRTA